jgi:hypothetical protein
MDAGVDNSFGAETGSRSTAVETGCRTAVVWWSRSSVESRAATPKPA